MIDDDMLDQLERAALDSRDATWPQASADGEFHRLADPEMVLALIAELRRLRDAAP